MDDYADFYYVDTRNADPRDHRVGSAGVTTVMRPPAGSAVAVAPPMGRAYPAQRVPTYATAAPVAYANPYANPYAMANPYGVPYGAAPSPFGSLFGGLSGGQVIDLIGQGIAALQSLPSAPTKTGDVATDLGNLTLYQTALANHAKSDERIRTIASLASRLLGGA